VKRLMIIGLAVLSIGVGLLVFTFIVAYLFLVSSPAIFIGEGVENAFAGGNWAAGDCLHPRNVSRGYGLDWRCPIVSRHTFTPCNCRKTLR